MAADIVFDQSRGDSISLQATRVYVTGRINLPPVMGALPPAEGQVGDLVMTVEETHNQFLNISTKTTRLWLCVPADDVNREVAGPSWREVQLGHVTAING